jgi:hypothetical protein
MRFLLVLFVFACLAYGALAVFILTPRAVPTVEMEWRR